MAVVVAAIEADIPALLPAVPLVGVVIVVANRAGVAYAVPVAMASVLAYDWYYILTGPVASGAGLARFNLRVPRRARRPGATS